MKVVFIQPGQFLRTSRKTNPFFDPIIDVCQKNGIDWELYLPSVQVETGYPKDHIRDYHWFSFFSTWFWRATHVLLPWLSVSRVHWLHGFFARPFCRAWREADIVIIIAQMYSNELVAIRPQKRVVDVQHGVIYSTHSGHFTCSGLLRTSLQRYGHYAFWLYGPGYANCFFKNPENHRWLDGRVKVVGDVVRAGKSGDFASKCTDEAQERNVIAFSAQLTYDLDSTTREEMVRRMVAFFEELHARYGSTYRYVLKQHPRFDRCCDISTLTALTYVEFVNSSWTELYRQMVLHVTFSSTVTFDAASAGVPTYLPPYPENKILDGRFYGTDFNYPFAGQTVEELLALMKDAEATMKTTHDWFQSCYAPFDEQNCLSLIRGEK